MSRDDNDTVERCAMNGKPEFQYRCHDRRKLHEIRTTIVSSENEL